MAPAGATRAGAMWAGAAALLASACSTPGPPGPTAGDGPQAPTVLVAPEDAAAPTEAPDAGMSAWQAGCADWLRAAIREAVKRQPGLRGAWVEHETMGPRESVLIAAFPPVFPTGGLHVRVERSPGLPQADGGPPGWQMFAESLHGGYHATFMRKVGEVEAMIGFDGWQSREVQDIAPLFEAAAAHCDSPAAAPGTATTPVTAP